MSQTPQKTRPTTGVFAWSGPTGLASTELEESPRDTPGLQELRELRLLLRGESIVDWHRLDIKNNTQAERLFRLNGIDLSDEKDIARLGLLRNKAHNFIRSTLRLRVHESIISDIPVRDLPILASNGGALQRDACLMLKVMHVIYHLEARELRRRLPISDTDLFFRVEQSVLRTFDELREAGLPAVEFAWSRKQPASLITKLLLKRETLAAQVFDRLRFRLIVREPEDLEPTLHLIFKRCIPFNFVVPGQTVNSLVDDRELDRRITEFMSAPLEDSQVVEDQPRPSTEQAVNEYTSSHFRVLNFVADLPVRIDALAEEHHFDPVEHGRVVFVLAEFQVCDQATAKANEEGPSAHSLYKTRQLAGARHRLLKRPSSSKAGATE